MIERSFQTASPVADTLGREINLTSRTYRRRISPNNQEAVDFFPDTAVFILLDGFQLKVWYCYFQISISDY